MLRPLEWAERVEAAPGITDMILGIFAPSGDQIFTATGYEDLTTPGLYKSDVLLAESFAGATYILRWRSILAGFTSVLPVFVTGERLSPEAVTVLVGDEDE